jgi:hypothetical protein
MRRTLLTVVAAMLLGTSPAGLPAQQGSSRTMSSTSASLTQMAGGRGFIFSGGLRPFITEIRPIVGGGGGPLLPMSPLRQRLQQLNAGGGLPPAVRPPLRPVAPIVAGDDEDDAFILGRRAADERPTAPGGLAASGSSAESGDESVADIKGRLAAEDAAREEVIAGIVDEADRLEAAGELRAAANEFGRAAAKAEGELREALLRKARALRKNR